MLEGDDDDEEAEKRIDDTAREISPERVARERAQGSRDRDISRMINGVEGRPRCAADQRCTDQNVCMPRPMDSKYHISCSY